MQCLGCGRHVRPETGPGAGCEAGALTYGRDVLVGEPAAQRLDRFDIAPADHGDVAEVRGIGPVAGEDAGDGLVEFGESDGSTVGGVFDSEVQTAVAAEQRSDPRRAVGGRRGVGHGGSGSSVSLLLNFVPGCLSGCSPARCSNLSSRRRPIHTLIAFESIDAHPCTRESSGGAVPARLVPPRY